MALYIEAKKKKASTFEEITSYLFYTVHYHISLLYFFSYFELHLDMLEVWC